MIDVAACQGLRDDPVEIGPAGHPGELAQQGLPISRSLSGSSISGFSTTASTAIATWWKAATTLPRETANSAARMARMARPGRADGTCRHSRSCAASAARTAVSRSAR